ncbi:iron-sulfur cluster assembly scaffold protein [Desulfosporosinus metallidurans]|uniref:Iron-sulfur cluster assembly scaffold protein IscU/NifU-like n=1 Tax=Desulfosporosinus metallidurans TaxID=1888891 RepID=A0A1Q8QZQ1_9FIRM|nr:iron-sulfur cluster assembly scaffold protein [Desulfosporosinus metallidurans]OLN32817.1 Iron-sulfur cluster assembly scaffold protein IscU/NifU-like [Desulfosporosinus metallidurans]
MYSQKVMELLKCPQNVGTMQNSDGEGTIEDPNKGDALTIYIRVQFRIITEISFVAIGSTAAVTTGSLITVLAKGKCIDEAMTISEQDVLQYLDCLPEEERQCANLGVSALRKAIENYAVKRGIFCCHIDTEVSSASKFNFSVKK